MRYVLAAALLICAAPAIAAGPYSLGDCFRLAMQRSETLGEDLEAVRQAEENARQARAAFLPSASLDAVWTRQEKSSDPLSQSLFPSSQKTAQVTATQSLFKGFQDLAILRQKNRQKQASAQSWRQAYLQLYQDTAQAYFAVLKDEHALRNYGKELESDKRRHDQLASMRRFGRAREADVVSITASIASVEASLASSEGALGADSETLAFLTGKDSDLALVDVDTVPALPGGLESWQSRVESRPDVQAARLNWQASESGVSAARGGYLPSLDLTGNYYLTRPGAYSGVHWDGQLSLSVPIFSGGKTRSQVRQAGSVRDAARLAYSAAQRQGLETIRSAYRTVSNEIVQARKLAAATSMYDRYYALLLKDNQAGIATNIDVLLALATVEQTCRAADSALLSANGDYARLLAVAADQAILAMIPGDANAHD